LGPHKVHLNELEQKMKVIDLSKIIDFYDIQNQDISFVVNSSRSIIVYYIGFETTTECPKSLVELDIAKQKWAVFDLSSTSPQTLYNIWYYLFIEWFPTNEYELVENAEFIRVLKFDVSYELWVPVVKSKSQHWINEDKDHHTL
jgi:predicted transcriptional regulator YdeE